jgi:hypothetical protein
MQAVSSHFGSNSKNKRDSRSGSIAGIGNVKRRGKKTHKPHITVSPFDMGKSRVSEYSKSKPPKRNVRVAVASDETIVTSVSDSDVMAPLNANAALNLRSRQTTVVPSECHFSNSLHASSGLITATLPPPLAAFGPIMEYLSSRLDASSEAENGAAKLRLRFQQPLRASRAMMNGRGKSYTKRSAKTRPLSCSPASLKKRLSGA